jgi:hypothetical protein
MEKLLTILLGDFQHLFCLCFRQVALYAAKLRIYFQLLSLFPVKDAKSGLNINALSLADVADYADA